MNCAADILNPGDRVRMRDLPTAGSGYRLREGRVAAHERHPCMTSWCLSVEFDGDRSATLCKPTSLEALKDGKWVALAG